MNIGDLLEKYDRSQMFSLIKNFPQQFEQAREIAQAHDLPAPDAPFEHIAFTGMGGSAIGGDLLANLLTATLTIPTYVNRSYSLPNFISKSSLVVASSYSGNTEETLTALTSVIERKPYVLCISSDGKLEQLANEHGFAFIKVPGGQPPRTALGYSFVPMLTAFEKLGIIAHQDDVFKETLALLKNMSAEYSNFEAPQNKAVQLAQTLVEKTPIIYGADEPNAALPTRWRNQMSENAKMLAFGNLLPEMNHNEIVGWASPTAILDRVHVILLQDDQNNQRIKIRFEATKEILIKNNIPFTELYAQGDSKMARTFSLIYFADFVSFYLALLNGVDPTPIENIDYLKNKLAKIS